MPHAVLFGVIQEIMYTHLMRLCLGQIYRAHAPIIKHKSSEK
jgi:hypothetical protein